MAWSSAFVGTSSISHTYAFRPMLVVPTGRHKDWRWENSAGGGYDYLDPGIGDPDYPLRRASDFSAELVAEAYAGDAVGAYQIWLLMPLTGLPDFDVVCLINHNLKDVFGLGSSYIQMQIADNAGYSTNLATLAEMSVATNARQFIFNLNHDAGERNSSFGYRRVYSGVAYARLKIVLSVPVGEDWVPQPVASAPFFGEVVIGRSYQLSANFVSPMTETYDAGIREFIAPSGHTKRFVNYSGRRRFKGDIQFASRADAQYLRDAWAASGYGARPVLWCPDPMTTPHETYLVRWTCSNFQEYVSGETVVSLDMTEMPPFVSTETL